MEAKVKIKFEGMGLWTLRNEGGAFDFLMGLGKAGITRRLSTGEGPSGTFPSVRTDQLDEVRRQMAQANVEEIRGDGKRLGVPSLAS